MKDGIHPDYVTATVTCGCGETFVTRSTRDHITVEICSKCHPFYTGRQKLVDSAGMVERFEKRFKWSGRADQILNAPKPKPAPKPQPAKPAFKVGAAAKSAAGKPQQPKAKGAPAPAPAAS